jgi:hypothetical protein
MTDQLPQLDSDLDARILRLQEAWRVHCDSRTLKTAVRKRREAAEGFKKGVQRPIRIPYKD